MTRVILFGIILLWTTVASYALDVRVLSGEHKGFTRLVLVSSVPAEAQISESPTGFLVTVDSEIVNYDISGVFSKIRRERISDVLVSPSGQALEITTACECVADLVEVQRGVYAIDFYVDPNASASPVQPEETPATIEVQQLQTDAGQPRTATPRQVQAMEILPLGLPTPARAPRAPLEVVPVDTPEPPPTGDQQTDVAALRQMVLEGLIEATNQSGISADTDLISASGPTPLPLAGRNLQITNSGIQDLSDLDPALVTNCGEAPDLDLASTYRERAPEQVLFETRAALAEQERLAAAEISDIARSYLWLGFGAEAELVLSDVEDDRLKASYSAIAKMLESGLPGEDGALEPFRDCSDTHSFWAALNGDALFTSDAEEAFLGVLDTLPQHLREALSDVILALIKRSPVTPEFTRLVSQSYDRRSQNTSAAELALPDDSFRDQAAIIETVEYRVQNQLRVTKDMVISYYEALNLAGRTAPSDVRKAALSAGLGTKLRSETVQILEKMLLNSVLAQSLGTFGATLAEIDTELRQLLFRDPADRAELATALEALPLPDYAQIVYALGFELGDVRGPNGIHSKHLEALDYGPVVAGTVTRASLARLNDGGAGLRSVLAREGGDYFDPASGYQTRPEQALEKLRLYEEMGLPDLAREQAWRSRDTDAIRRSGAIDDILILERPAVPVPSPSLSAGVATAETSLSEVRERTVSFRQKLAEVGIDR